MQKLSRFIYKSSGKEELFSEEKVYRSLRNCGANDEVIKAVLSQIEDPFEGLTTEQLFQKAYRILKKNSVQAAAKYKLKRAILHLGESGYPFEHLVARLIAFQSYQTKVGVTIQGQCIHHEVDVLAEKDNQFLLVECKHHKTLNNKSGVQVPLYVHARYQDIVQKWHYDTLKKDKQVEGWIVTNTLFSEDARQYGKCVGLKLISWDYPSHGSLKERIEISRLYPISVLSCLTKAEWNLLLDQNIIVIQDFCLKINQLKALGFKASKIKMIEKEVALICNT